MFDFLTVDLEENPEGQVYKDNRNTHVSGRTMLLPRQNQDYTIFDTLSAFADNPTFSRMFHTTTQEDLDYAATELKISPIREHGFNKMDFYNQYINDPDIKVKDNYLNEVYGYKDALSFYLRLKDIRKNQEIFAQAPGGRVAAFLSETIGDPAFLASLALNPSWSVTKFGNAVRFGLAGGTSALATETLRAPLDPTRTREEAALNIGLATVIGSALGPALPTVGQLEKSKIINTALPEMTPDISAKVGTLSDKSPVERLAKKVSVDLNELSARFKNKNLSTNEVEDINELLEPKAVGANIVAVQDYVTTPAGSELARKIVEYSSFAAPRNAVARAQIKESKDLLTRFFRPSYETVADREGVALGETAEEIAYFEIIDFDRHNFAQQNFAQKAVRERAETVDNGYTMAEFQEEQYRIVQDKMLSDEDLLKFAEESDRPDLFEYAYNQRQVAAKAKENLESVGAENFEARQNYGYTLIFDKIKSAADEENLYIALKEQYQEFADEVIKKYEARLKDPEELEDWLFKNAEEMVASKTATKAEAQKMMDEIQDQIHEIKMLIFATDDAVQELASKKLTSILHGGDPAAAYIGFNNGLLDNPGIFLSRTLDPIKLQPWLITDPAKLNSIYARKYANAYSLAKKFDGDVSGKKTIKEYADKMDDKIQTLRERGMVDEANKLSKEKSEVIKTIQSYQKLATGQYANEFYNSKYGNVGASIIDTANMGVTLSKSGATALASIGELTSISLYHGITDVIPDAAKIIKKMATDPEFRKLTTELLNESRRAMEISHNSVLADIAMAGDNIGDLHTIGFRVRENINKWFYRINGQVYWDFAFRKTVALVQQSQFRRNLQKVLDGAADENLISDLTFLGVPAKNKGIVKSLVDELDNAAIDFDGITLFENAKLSPEFRQMYQLAMLRDLRRAVNLPSSGSVPFFFAHPIIRPLAKYKTWSLMAHQNYMLRAVQRADSSVGSGIAAMVGWNAIALGIKNQVQGREFESAEGMLYAAITNSGLTGATPELGLDWLAYKAGIRDGGAAFQARNTLWDTIGGAGGRYINDLQNTAGAALSLDDEKFLKHARKIMPLQNHPVVDNLLREDN